MISIIIPTLNEETILEKTLKNVKQINRFPVEIIVADSRSTDKTVQIAGRYADKVVVYEKPDKPNAAKGRNLGAQNAHGEYLMFVDADVFKFNLVPDDFVTGLVREFEKDEKLLAATVNLLVSPEMERFWDHVILCTVNLLHYLNNNIFHTGSSSGELQFIRRSAFEKLGGYNEILVASEDQDMFIRLAKLGKTKLIRSLSAYHTGRRPHKIGWPKLIYIWMKELAYYKFTKKSAAEEWTPIR